MCVWVSSNGIHTQCGMQDGVARPSVSLNTELRKLLACFTKRFIGKFRVENTHSPSLFLSLSRHLFSLLFLCCDYPQSLSKVSWNLFYSHFFSNFTSFSTLLLIFSKKFKNNDKNGTWLVAAAHF